MINKWLYARRLAAALGYVALCSGDRLTVVNLRSADRQPGVVAGWFAGHLGPLRGRGQALRYLDWLERAQAGGVTDLNAALRGVAAWGKRPGLVMLVSDLFSPAGCAAGLGALAAQGHELAVLHVLSPDELDPPLGGDLRLLDIETGQAQEVTIDAWTRARYRRRLAAWQDEVRAACRSRGARYVFVSTGAPVDRIVLYELRRAGVVG